jgi:hypothetical protein
LHDRTQRSLYHRANGYNYEAVKIFMPANREKPVIVPFIEHVPPDVTACIFWDVGPNYATLVSVCAALPLRQMTY